jgi:acyl-coenzyme A thioesterase PaaI-like protein
MSDPVDSAVTVDAVNEMVHELFPGTRNYCIELGPDFAIAGYDTVDADIRPGGFISGPTQFGLIDCALWFLAFAALDRIEPMALTSELSIRFLRPAQGSSLRCRATLESVSRRSVVGTAHVWVDGRPEKITATAQGTYAVPLPR